MELAIFHFLPLCFPGTHPRHLCLSAGLQQTKNSQRQETRPVQANQSCYIRKVQRIFITGLSSQQCKKEETGM